MKYEIDSCSECDCGSKRLIVNKRYWLCDQKNKERLHGKDYFRGKPKYSLKRTPIKSKSRVRRVSKKGQEIERKYAQTISEIDRDREPKCEGCGRYQGGEVRLSHSHVISRQQAHNIGKPELIYDKRNIRFHCLDFGNHKGCHTKWEHPVKKKELIDFEKNCLFIKTVSVELFNKVCQDLKN